jgi:HTH-type transcriptional regulator/antitoxin HigA
MKTEKITFESEREYKSAMGEISSLMDKGEGNLTQSEVTKLRNMAVAAEEFEDFHYPFPKPKTISEMVELKALSAKTDTGRVG